MKRFLIIPLIILIVFASCAGDSKEVNSDDKRTADSILSVLDEAISHASTECAEIENDTMHQKGLFRSFCPSDTINDIPISRRMVYPFDTTRTKTKDTTIYTFKVSYDCCHKFNGNYYLSGDTLVMTYSRDCNPCDCYCDYILTYKVSNKKFRHKHIAIRSLDRK